MITKIKLLVFTSFILAIFSSCFDGPDIFGNNEIAEETRTLPNFSEVSVSGDINVYYAHGDSTGVRIECESNLLPYVETAVFDNSLNIRFAQHANIHHNIDIEIYVTSPAISKIQLSGSGKIEADSVSANSLEIEMSGSGSIGNVQTHFYGENFKSTISGSGHINIITDCKTVETDISGSGRINLEAYNCLTTNVTISGSGKAELTGSSDKATFEIVGSGKISAYEFPVNKAEVEISGSGDVYVNATESIDALLIGSGDLHYIGSPKINYETSGSGKVINEN